MGVFFISNEGFHLFLWIVIFVSIAFPTIHHFLCLSRILKLCLSSCPPPPTPQMVRAHQLFKIGCFFLPLMTYRAARALRFLAKNKVLPSYRFWIDVVHYLFCYLKKWMRVGIWCLFLRHFSSVIWVVSYLFLRKTGETVAVVQSFNVQDTLASSLWKLYGLGCLSNYFLCLSD